MERTKVAVLGGGLGAIAAAFYLTDTSEKRARFQVTVFTDEHRLGGKTGSGRNLDHGGRIEEHGLHILLGFYDEMFGLLRAVWADWRPPADGPFQSLDDALEPQRRITFPERVPRRPGWDFWHVDFPHVAGRPGGSAPGTPLDRPAGALDRWAAGRRGLRAARPPARSAGRGAHPAVGARTRRRWTATGGSDGAARSHRGPRLRARRPAAWPGRLRAHRPPGVPRLAEAARGGRRADLVGAGVGVLHARLRVP
ncbi:MAG: NAD(P)-binding protein [Proteobacteria bacterium]|nr:NAD(P)-binding protein [Pseudomonadota bacterium]MCP4920105.1 NAD(P)-binding protein [Pseudomonadota bacterium]